MTGFNFPWWFALFPVLGFIFQILPIVFLALGLIVWTNLKGKLQTWQRATAALFAGYIGGGFIVLLLQSMQESTKMDLLAAFVIWPYWWYSFML